MHHTYNGFLSSQKANQQSLTTSSIGIARIGIGCASPSTNFTARLGASLSTPFVGEMKTCARNDAVAERHGTSIGVYSTAMSTPTSTGHSVRRKRTKLGLHSRTRAWNYGSRSISRTKRRGLIARQLRN